MICTLATLEACIQTIRASLLAVMQAAYNGEYNVEVETRPLRDRSKASSRVPDAGRGVGNSHHVKGERKMQERDITSKKR